MPTSWIYNLSKEELIRESKERKLPTIDLTVDKLRKQLSDYVREEEEEPFEMTSEDQGRTANQPSLSAIVKEWNIYFDATCDPVEFIERLEELTATGDIPQERLLQILPKILRGKPLLWHRNNCDNWEKWEEFLEDFKLFYYPAGYEKNLQEKIIARKQKYRESFVDYLTDIQTLMRRYGKMTKKDKEDRIYENMNANYKYYIKRQDFSSLGELIKQAADYEQICEERYRTNTRFTPTTEGASTSQQWNHRPDQQSHPPKNIQSRNAENRTIHPKYDKNTCCWNCGKPGHSHKECRGRQVIFCSQCGLLGRLTRNCCKRPARVGDTYLTVEEHRPENRIFETIKIGDRTYKALVDTGSTRSYISKEIYEENSKNPDKEKISRMKITVADGRTVDIEHRIYPEIEIQQRKITHELFVLPTEKPSNLVIIGMDILKRTGATINWNNDVKETPHETRTEKQTKPPFRIQKSTELTEHQQKILEETIRTEFERCEKSPKGNTWVEHRIKMKHNEPIKQKYYPRNPKLQQIIDEHVQEMLQNGIIEKSDSPYSSPVVLAKKENGKYRFCIDFRKVNEASEKDAYPLPQIDHTLEKLIRANWFSKIDLKNGYWNVKLADESKRVTAFTVPGRGLFQFRVMPFGLHSSGSTFQRLLDRVIGPELEPNAYVYCDDIIVCSETFTEHITHLKEIFKRIREARLQINIDKCEFCKPELEYLGHIVTREGIKMDASKIQAINEMKPPTTIKETRRFIGMTSWYRKFIPNYANVMAPLITLLKKNRKFEWGEPQENAFREIKKIITQSPILTRADFTRPFILETDASDVGIGAVLMQEQEGEKKVIMYASRSLSAPETRYTTAEKECLAVVWGVKKMKAFLEGYQFTVITDHQALKWLNTLKNPSGRLARWALELQQYDFNIEYRPGKNNQIADQLSRNPALATIEDKKNWYERKHSETLKSPDADPSFCIKNDKLYKKISNPSYGLKINTESEWKLCIPASDRTQTIKENHDEPTAGHLGAGKTMKRIAQRYYWPGMYRDVLRYVKKCMNCQTHKTSQEKRPGQMHINNPEGPWQTITTDLIGPLPRSSNGHIWIIVFHDKFTKWSEIRPLRTATAPTITKALKECVIMKYGCPTTVVSDNGRQFVSKQFTDELKKYDIKHELTAPYSPQSNPTERVNKTLGTMIATFINENHKKWDQFLPEFNFALNTSIQESTQYTPAFLMFGRELRMPRDKNQFPVATIKDKSNMEEIYEIAKINQNKASLQQKRHYDSNKRTWYPRINETVLKREFPLSCADKNFCAKLAPKYSGPYIITDKKSPVIFELKHMHNHRKYIAHIKDLKTYNN